MKRDTSERRAHITNLVQTQGSVQVAKLADQFNVSPQTIRKDLHYLTEKGVTTRSYGGAIASSVITAMSEPPVESKRLRFPEEKSRIGKAAAALVQPGDAIILDSGTTTLFIAQHLPDVEDITVLTNDFGIMKALTSKRNIQVIMLGGALRRKNMAFYGSQTEISINNVFVSKLFIGVDGFDLSNGITTHYEPEAELNRLMVKIAQEVVAVTDSSKFGQTCLHRIVDIHRVDRLITDDGIPEDVRTGCEIAGIDVTCV